MADGAKLAVRAYALVLRIRQPSFLAPYRDDMLRTFEARVEPAFARSALHGTAFALREIGDLLSIRSNHVGRSAMNQPTRPRPPALTTMSLLTDVRYACRLLRRQPAFSAVALVTLALGIGATTAVFTVVNAVLLRPLPYADPDRIVQLFNGRNGRLSLSFSPPNYRDITTDTGVFANAAAITPSSANLTGFGDPRQLDGANVTAKFFDVLGVAPARGRGFNEADTAESGEAVVILSDELWRSLFAARADAVGSMLRLDGTPFTIIGIAPPDLRVPSGAAYWRPLKFSIHNLEDTQRGAQWVSVIARLKQGVSLEQAQTAITTVAERLARDFPRTNKDRVMTAMRLQDRIVSGIRPALLVLLGAVTLVLLVACVNVANLLLARAHGRAREVAVRAAVGAGRLRLVQMFLAESLVLGLLGAVGGLAVAYWAARALVALAPAQIPRLAEIGVDWKVLGFAVGVASATSLAFGLVPAFATIGGAISLAGRGAVGPAGARTRKALVVCEMALAVVLLVGAGLLIRSYQRISDVDPGFAPDHVLTFTLGLPESTYKTSDAVGRFVRDYVEKLASHPDVINASGIFGLPLDNNFTASSSFTRAGETDSGDSPSVGMRIVTPDYFKTLKIPLRSGRTFDPRDNDAGPEVVVINEEAARRYWPGQNPIGQQLHLGVRLASGVRSGQKTIVGVVGDVKYGGLDASAPPEVYLPHAQHPVDSLTIAVRTRGEPMAFVPAARALLATIDRELPLASIKAMDEIVGRSVAQRRFMMLLIGAFAAVAVLLAAIGVYGVLAYVVSQRTREIGLRLAIGAAPGDVVRLFVREGVILAGIGVALGLAGALGASRVLATMLFGVTAQDPLTFGAVAASLAVAAFGASYFPARRAAKVDPMAALRTE